MKIMFIEINWKELKKKLHLKYPKLTNEDLKTKEGSEEDMLRMVEYKLGLTKDEMNNIIKKL